MDRQPQFFKTDSNQSIFLLASAEDGIYVNTMNKMEVDLNDTFDIDLIKELAYDPEDGVFYILANKFEEKLGFFVIQFKETDPYTCRYLIKWKNKLDISDTNISVLRNQATKYKELIISYKCIFINTYNVVCMDISVADQ
mmetsp:Transcript_2923/g.4512  ORF Transcript_2923/g.4512 Transcript_2923/m.4512 type:complete len:140 (-) Transcript_2923:2179-2598(-)